MTIITTNQLSARTTLVLKFAFLLALYAAAIWIIVGYVSNALIGFVDLNEPIAQFTAEDYGRVLLAPTTIAVGVTAWLLRGRWFDLRTPQLFVAGVAMAIACMPIFLLVLFLFQSLLHFERFSTDAWAVASRLLSIITGVLVGQILRLRRKTSTSAYV